MSMSLTRCGYNNLLAREEGDKFLLEKAKSKLLFVFDLQCEIVYNFSARQIMRINQ
jgi:hypothetical protein